MKYLGTAAVGAVSGRNGAMKLGQNMTGGRFKRPSNPRTPAQSLVRANFTSTTKSWATLTDAQRLGWIALAVGQKKADRFGTKYSQKGKQLYSQLNNNLLQCGQAAISAAPSSATVVSPTAGAFGTNTNAAQTVTFATTPVPTGYNYIISMTKPLSAGYSKAPKSGYRVVSIVAAAGTSPANTLAAYTAQFGAPVTGKKIFAKIVAVNLSNGFKSAPLAFSGTTA